MIKYEIKTGDSTLNRQARNQRDVAYKPVLKGMHCGKCKNDTIIEFVESDLTHVKALIHSYCSDFDKCIRHKLWPNKN